MKNPHAAALGRTRTPRKAASSRQNGKLGGQYGGRPRAQLLSRRDETTITESWWWYDATKDIAPHVLSVKTAATGDREFRLFASDDANLPANRSGFGKRYAVGAIVRIGDLAGIPAEKHILGHIAPGINMMVGAMNDGLNNLCGRVVFARLVDYEHTGYVASDAMMAVAREAAELFGRNGPQAAAEHMRNSGMFREIVMDDDMLHAPGAFDPCAWDLR